MSPSIYAEAVAGAPCSTPDAAIYFDFEGAPQSRCHVDGPRAFSILITPEHAPPINPSPWYAFRYEARGDAAVTVTLNYDGADHRYAPKFTEGETISELSAVVSNDERTATLSLPSRSGIVSAQPLLDQAYYNAQLDRLSQFENATRMELGRSHDGRAIEAVHVGAVDAPELIILLGRQHPPEVTGAYAFEPFAQRLLTRLAENPATAARFQVLMVPLLNPDGVARGHWRANLGAVDLNRDWGVFSQPETASVQRWLANLPASARPVLMLDFHSTQRNLFYVQGDDAPADQQQFLTNWLAGKEEQFPGYSFTLERRNANPGSGTSKNWFHETYDIPAYTYEVGDRTDEASARLAAEQLANDLAEILAATE